MRRKVTTTARVTVTRTAVCEGRSLTEIEEAAVRDMEQTVDAMKHVSHPSHAVETGVTIDTVEAEVDGPGGEMYRWR